MQRIDVSISSIEMVLYLVVLRLITALVKEEFCLLIYLVDILEECYLLLLSHA